MDSVSPHSKELKRNKYFSALKISGICKTVQFYLGFIHIAEDEEKILEDISSPEYRSLRSLSTLILEKMGLKLGNQLQFKRGLEQNTSKTLTLASNVNLWKYMEIVQHSTEHQRSALSYFNPKAQINSPFLVRQHVYLSIYSKVM
jgi:hypothetical protein